MSVYEKHVANEDDASIFVHGIVLKDKEGNIVKELNATPGNYVENGNTSQVYEDGVVALNQFDNAITYTFALTNDLGDAVSEDKAESGAFEIMSTTVGSKKIVLTFAVSDQVKDFAVIAVDENGNSVEKPLFTWDSKNDVTNGTVEGVTVKQRVAADAKIYVVSLPKSVAAGHYKLYVTTDDSYAPTEFDIVKNDDGE